MPLPTMLHGNIARTIFLLSDLPFIVGVRSGKYFILTLTVGVVFGFLSACLLITSTRDVPYMFNLFPASFVLSRDPHHYSELESEVNRLHVINTFQKISFYLINGIVHVFNRSDLKQR